MGLQEVLHVSEERICAECGDDLAAEGHMCCTECMERAVLCPECHQGKYPNCAREALDDEDVLVPCESWKVAPA